MKFAGPFQRSWIRERPQFDSTGCPIPVVKKSWCEWPSLLIIQPDAVHDLHMSFQMSVFGMMVFEKDGFPAVSVVTVGRWISTTFY